LSIRILVLLTLFAVTVGMAAAQTGPPGPPHFYPPALAWAGGNGYVSGGVQPTSGASGTSFTFKVMYSHQDDSPGVSSPPAWVHLCLRTAAGAAVSGSPFTMASDGTTDYADGVTFNLTLKLAAPGAYSYRFQTFDGADYANLPTGGGFVTGPTVNGVPAPVLSFAGTTGFTTGGVSPASGREATFFTFKIKYTQSTGLAPTSVTVHIWGPAGKAIAGSPFTMTAASGSPNYETGAIFQASVSLTKVGVYTYDFTASDGAQTVTYPAAKLTGPTVTS
jgi:hypothetical protein